MFERIFIDASYTLASGKNSGIERVVTSIIRESAKMGDAGAIPKPQVIVSIDGNFYAPSEEQAEYFRRPAAMHANVLSATPQIYRKLAEFVCRATGSQKLRKWLLPQAGHLGLFKIPHNIFESHVQRRIARGSKRVEFGQGDLVLLPDAYWVNRLRDSIWPAAAEARQRGSLVATLLYDLIPLTHPEFVGLKRRNAFLAYLKKVASNSDLILAISETVRREVADYLESVADPDNQFCKDIRSFQLGAELQSRSGVVRPEVIEIFGGKMPPYLMVATFDPRKNHEFLLNGFELLWKTNADLKLCLVGRIGSRCDDVVKRIMNHEQLGKSLFLFSDLSDFELHHCYEAARGVIFPSVVEGFGLPIVESLWFGKKTFVSDTPIHREVGAGDCCYFGLEDPQLLANSIQAWEKSLSSGQSLDLPSRRPTTWSDSTKQLLQHCYQATAARQPQLRKAA